MSETALRLTIFAGVFAVLAGLEVVAPWRAAQRRGERWPGNLGLIVVDAAVVRLAFPLSAAGVALLAEAEGWGLFNLMVAPGWLALPLGIVLLDLVIYAQHVLFHHVPWLWRLHRVHHADTVLDVSTGLRFHPIEILISMTIKIAAVLLLGVPALAVVAFEVILNATAMFNHANIHLPARVDRLVRLVIVTPDMHRVHHSVLRAETDSNYGFNLPWWDWLFGTYRAEPAAGRACVEIGIGAFSGTGEERLDRLMTQPFREAGAAGPDRDQKIT